MRHVGKGFLVGAGDGSLNLTLKDKWQRREGVRELEEGWRGAEAAALTVGQGVALKPIQVLLVQYLGQGTAIDEVSTIHHQEATCHADKQHLHHHRKEQGACQPLRAQGI